MSQKSVDFLRQLLRQIRSKLLVIGDGAPIHRGQPVKDFLAAGAATRLQREQLPAYAPEQNPDEGVRNYLKGVELRNVRCQDPAHLRDALRLAVTRLRHKRAVLRGCVRPVRLRDAARCDGGHPGPARYRNSPVSPWARPYEASRERSDGGLPTDLTG